MAEKKTRAKKPKPEVPAEIKSIKGFNRDLTCNGFQFEAGKTFEHEGAVSCCRSGFHACKVEAHPLEVLGFYAPGTSRYFDVVQHGPFDSNDDVKICSAKITIGLELSISELTRRAIEWVFSRAKPEKGSSATGVRGAASATGYAGAASATGVRGAASATGYAGAASATGDAGAASATGYAGAASATGVRGAASATGREGRVAGKNGCAVFAVERDVDWAVVSVACGIIGQDGLREDTWYGCRGGKLVEIDDG